MALWAYEKAQFKKGLIKLGNLCIKKGWMIAQTAYEKAGKQLSKK
jgi:hypothetical protein